MGTNNRGNALGSFLLLMVMAVVAIAALFGLVIVALTCAPGVLFVAALSDVFKIALDTGQWWAFSITASVVFFVVVSLVLKRNVGGSGHAIRSGAMVYLATSVLIIAVGALCHFGFHVMFFARAVDALSGSPQAGAQVLAAAPPLDTPTVPAPAPTPPQEVSGFQKRADTAAPSVQPNVAEVVPPTQPQPSAAAQSPTSATNSEAPARTPVPEGQFGAGAYVAGNGIEKPILVTEKKPEYTADAMRAKLEGSVDLEVVVLADGTVGDVRVTKSLDGVHGLDLKAIEAAKQCRFTPGTNDGVPVPVLMAIVMVFALH